MNSASDVSPAKFLTGTWIADATLAHNSRSDPDPKIATDAPSSFATRLAASAKRSGSQRLAVPYAAPGLMPTIDLAQTELAEFCSAGVASECRALQANQIVVRNPIDDAGAAQKFQIVKPLMTRNLARLGYRDRLRQQRRSPVARVADAGRDAGQRRRSRRLRRHFAIGSRSRNVQREGCGRPDISRREWRQCMESADRKTARARTDRPPTAWPGSRSRAEGNRSRKRAESGQRHDRVAHPIGRANENPFKRHLWS